MKFRVATQITGGFALIGTLLLVLGYVSISGLHKIGDNFTNVSDVAIPALTGSAELKVDFLNMGRLSFEGYTAKDLDVVETKQTEFEQSKERFNAALGTLQSAVNQNQDLSAAVGEIAQVYNRYIKSVSNVFSLHKQSLQMDAELSQLGEVIEYGVDDATTVLMDLIDSDAIQTAENSESITNAASLIESNALKVITNSGTFLSSETLQRAELRQQDVNVTAKAMQQNLNELQSFQLNEEATDYLDDISSYVEDIVNAIEGENGIIAVKLAQLSTSNDAQTALTASEQIVAEAASMLTALSELAALNAEEIKNQASSSVDSGVLISIVVLLISIGVAAFVSFSTTRSITLPLSKVNEFLNVASSGDLTHQLDDKSNNEFGELARNCNQLTNSLKELINGINNRAEQLAAASTDTSDINQASTALIEEQKNEISQVATATTEMHSTTELVTNCANNTLEEVKQADNEAEKVKTISNENKRTIQALAVEVDEAATVINQLHQDSAAISTILDVIRGVAEQTNLLALNAAIEAARAGEHGRGFAVVADEVRTLASRTQESAQEINAMIEALQAGAETAVSVMTKGKEQTKVCVEQTENAGSALNLITDAVHRAYEVSKQIKQASLEQHAASEQIGHRLESVVDIAEKTTEGARKTTSSSAEVSRLADELRHSISRFTV